MNSDIERLKNELNFEIRSVLKIVDMIDGELREYSDYKENTLTDELYLKQQIEMVKDAKSRLLNIFKYLKIYIELLSFILNSSFILDKT